MKSYKKMIRVSGLLRRVPEAVWFNPQGPGKKKTKQEKRFARRLHGAALANLRADRRADQAAHSGLDRLAMRLKALAGHAYTPPKTAVVTGRITVKETNKRYPLSEIRAAKAAGRKLKPQTKAAHW